MRILGDNRGETYGPTLAGFLFSPLGGIAAVVFGTVALVLWTQSKDEKDPEKRRNMELWARASGFACLIAFAATAFFAGRFLLGLIE